MARHDKRVGCAAAQPKGEARLAPVPSIGETPFTSILAWVLDLDRVVGRVGRDVVCSACTGARADRHNADGTPRWSTTRGRWKPLASTGFHGEAYTGPETREAPAGRGPLRSPGLATDHGRLVPGPGSFVYVVLKCSASHALCLPVCAVSAAAGVYTTFHEYCPVSEFAGSA